MNKILSIVIPSYNMQDYLPACLDSLVVDDPALFAALDIIVVNDGSKDKTSAIAHDYAARYPDVIRVIDKPNGNYGSCVNRGLAEARGVFIKVLDADDTFDTAAFKQFIRRLIESEEKNEQVDLFLTDYVRVGARGETRQYMSVKGLPAAQVLDSEALSHVSPVLMHAYAYRTEILRTMGYRQLEGFSYTDAEWSCYPILAVKKLCYLPLPVYRYLVERPGQTMDPEPFHTRWFPVRAHVALELAKHCEQANVLDRPGAKAYFRRWALETAKGIYRSALLQFPTRANVECLKDFDGRLRQVAPSIHAELLASSIVNRPSQSYGRVYGWLREGKNGCLRLLRAYYTARAPIFRILSKIKHALVKPKQSEEMHSSELRTK